MSFIGCNPKTGSKAPISPCHVIVFKPSAILKQRFNSLMTIVSQPDAEITDRECRCHVNFHIDPRTIGQPNEQRNTLRFAMYGACLGVLYAAFPEIGLWAQVGMNGQAGGGLIGGTIAGAILDLTC
jgi:hypothetical protein